MWFPLGHQQHCVVEKTPRGWELRVIRDGELLLTHPLEDALAERLISARAHADLPPTDR